MARTLYCPECDTQIEVENSELFVTCEECKTLWRVDYDADFVDGMWRDRTELVQDYTTNPEV